MFPTLFVSLITTVLLFTRLELTDNDVKDTAESKVVVPLIVTPPSILTLPLTSNEIAAGLIFPIQTGPPFTFKQRAFCVYSSAALIYALSHAVS